MKSTIDHFLFRNLLDDKERIVYVAHVHPFVIYSKLFKATLFGLIIPGLGYYLFPMMPEFWLAWAIIGAMVFAYRIIQWYMDAWVITNASVINHEWRSPFNYSTNRIEFGTIETTTSSIDGFWGMLFRFGHLQIDNTSSSPVVFKNMARPQKVERIIMEKQAQYVQNQTLQDHGQLKELLTSLLRSTQK